MERAGTTSSDERLDDLLRRTDDSFDRLEQKLAKLQRLATFTLIATIALFVTVLATFVTVS